jgi:hypothetical protein
MPMFNIIFASACSTLGGATLNLGNNETSFPGAYQVGNRENAAFVGFDKVGYIAAQQAAGRKFWELLKEGYTVGQTIMEVQREYDKKLSDDAANRYPEFSSGNLQLGGPTGRIAKISFFGTLGGGAKLHGVFGLPPNASQQEIDENDMPVFHMNGEPKMKKSYRLSWMILFNRSGTMLGWWER